VKATGSNAAATILVQNANTNAILGTMINVGNGTFWHQRYKPERPQDFPREVTVSDEGGAPGLIRLVESDEPIVPHKNQYGHELHPARGRQSCLQRPLAVISNDVVHSGLLRKNGGYHTNPASGEGAPSDDSS
jgi:hypothetical protein